MRNTIEILGHTRLEKRPYIVVQMPLISLQSKHIVSLFLANHSGHRPLAARGINAHRGAFDVQLFDGRRQCVDLVALHIDHRLPKNQVASQIRPALRGRPKPRPTGVVDYWSKRLGCNLRIASGCAV
jgi:hypothetical protein